MLKAMAYAAQCAHHSQSPMLLKFTVPGDSINLLHTCIFRKLYLFFRPLLWRPSSTFWFHQTDGFVYVVHFMPLHIHKLTLYHMFALTKLICHIFHLGTFSSIFLITKAGSRIVTVALQDLGTFALLNNTPLDLGLTHTCRPPWWHA